MEAPQRTLPPLVKSRKIRFGSIGYGLDLVRMIWPMEEQVFSMQDKALQKELPHRPRTNETGSYGQVALRIFKKNPVDVLLIDESHLGAARSRLTDHIAVLEHSRRPMVIALALPSDWALSYYQRGARKGRRKEFERMGYVCLEWFVQSQEQGGALHQDRLIEVMVKTTGDSLPKAPERQPLPSRPMHNLLMPCGIPYKDRAKENWIQRLDTTLLLGPCRIVGQVGNTPLYDPAGGMPDNIESWIDSERGVRRLQVDELAKAKGLASEWRAKGIPLSRKPVLAATSVHTWTAVCDSISTWIKEQPQLQTTQPYTPAKTSIPKRSVPPPCSIINEDTWDYEMPDLSKDGAWYQARVASLHKAVEGRPDAEVLILEGLEALEIHRGNYTEAGPRYLQVLWWEFPEAHQEAVRIGSSLRFLVDPGKDIIPNPPMTSEQIQVVETFFEELISLGVVRPAVDPLRRVCPIFVVEKVGQPGQWRCIADMKKGGQNACCSLDPIYMPSLHDILPNLYTGGWSAVADASKYFHNYATLPSERDLIGLIHPTTGKHYVYYGLPMGSVDSPSIACRIGEGLLDDLRRNPVFRAATRRENTWRTSLQDGIYDPGLSHGYVFFQKNGRPVAQIYGFVDDFFIHALTKKDCIEAMNCFMDLIIRVGLICQKVKTSPPSQQQKYCGFIYDTRSTPTLRIPPNKVSRCIASAKYLLAKPRGYGLSRLSLAVVTGVLQSIVEATPQHMGQTHLRALYDDLHRLEEVGHLTGAAKYGTVVSLGEASKAALDWWIDHLVNSPGATTCRATSSRGLVMKWGDGSGTGTGGTTELYPLQDRHDRNPNIEAWMGVWEAKAKPQSSNWKEARTVLQALLQERGGDRLRETTVFYMTDNLVSYYIINGGSSRSPGLHSLVQQIKAVALDLGCRLEVVHVPGTLMIIQGTDGLSRGLWMATERRMEDINQMLFEPVPYTVALGFWLSSLLHLEVQPTWRDFVCPTCMFDLPGTTTVWTPPPECARQVLAAFLRQWVQQPDTKTTGIFLIPRILQKSWSRVARYVEEVGVFHSAALPEYCRFDSHLPFVVLVVTPHVHALRRPRVVGPAYAKPKGWHQRQAEEVRRLS